MTTLEITLSIISVILAIIGLPAWSYIFKMRDTIKKADKFEVALADNVGIINKELVSFKQEVREKIREIDSNHTKFKEKYNDDMLQLQKDLGEDRIAFAEILGKINGTLVKLDNSVGNLNESIKRSEKHMEDTIKGIYKEIADHKTYTTKLIETLQKL